MHKEFQVRDRRVEEVWRDWNRTNRNRLYRVVEQEMYSLSVEDMVKRMKYEILVKKDGANDTARKVHGFGKQIFT